MKVKYIGKTEKRYFTHGKIYETLEKYEDQNLYRIVDDTGEDYMYCLDEFEILEDESEAV